MDFCCCPRMPRTQRVGTSWVIQDLYKRPVVFKVVGDQCPFGLWCSGADGPTMATYPAGWVVNSKRIVAALDHKCPGNQRHCHMKPRAGCVRALNVERYLLRLVNTVPRALRHEMLDRRGVSVMEAEQHVDELDVWLTLRKVYQEIHDATTGPQLDPKLVSTARNEEMKFYRQRMACVQVRTRSRLCLK